ncbi:MAG TPA: TIM barrel protein [Pirellulales bacterium]|jgi:sugar phosphate isomerase/epimerase|nr:TIM barrel protein [Pirellulales bacterium]
MEFKLACADFTFPLLAHARVLDLIASLDFDGVDIGLFEGRSHLWPSRVFKNSTAANQLATQLNDRGLAAADVFLQTATDFVSLACNQPQAARRRRARELFARTLDFAAAIGARHVSALPGVHFPEESRRESLARACEELAWRVERAHEHGMIFGVEAHVGSIVARPNLALELVRKVPGLTLTLDYTHFTKLGMADEQIEPLVEHASHFHARGARKGRLQASWNQNVIDYERVLACMRRTRYGGYIGIEYVWIDWEHCNEVDNLSETILMRDFFRARLNGKPRARRVRAGVG